MHFAVAPEHFKFFYNNNYIEFENLLTELEVINLNKVLKKSLSTRLKSSSECLHKTDLKTLYLSGLDMWRDEKIIKKISLHPRFAEIASTILKVRSLRIARDQLFLSSDIPSHLFNAPISLNEMCSVQGIIGGCSLRLSLSPDSDSSFDSMESGILNPFAQTLGGGIFFGPDTPLSFKDLNTNSETLHLMIIYANDISLYIHRDLDPHSHRLKNSGYIYGDRLKNSTHPILYRC